MIIIQLDPELHSTKWKELRICYGSINYSYNTIVISPQGNDQQNEGTKDMTVNVARLSTTLFIDETYRYES